MKEFKKWLNKEFPDVENYCPQCPEIAASAWKAAITWALEGFNSDINNSILTEKDAKKNDDWMMRR